MPKPFSEMTTLEQHVNRTRMRAGYQANWTEATGTRDLPALEGDVVSAAILDHVTKTQMQVAVARANASALADTLKHLSLSGKEAK